MDWCFVCTKHVRVDMSIVRALVHSLPKAKISSYVKIASSILQKDPQTRTHRHNHGYIYKPSSLPAPQTCARISHTHNNINACTPIHTVTRNRTRGQNMTSQHNTHVHTHTHTCAGSCIRNLIPCYESPNQGHREQEQVRSAVHRKLAEVAGILCSRDTSLLRTRGLFVECGGTKHDV